MSDNKSLIQLIEGKYKKHATVDVRSGDTVRVHQKIKEGNKERIQIFEGLVIRVTRRDSLMSAFTVRKIASGVGVEKTYLLHSPLIVKIEITKRSKVRRNYLTYMRGLKGKSAKLNYVEFDKASANFVAEKPVEAPAAESEVQTASDEPAASQE